MPKNIIFLITSTLLLSFCTISKTRTRTSDNTNVKNEITEKYWKLIALNGKSISMSASQEREIYMILKADSSKVKGFAGCNYFTGNYQLMNNGKIKFGNFAAGKKYCFVPTKEHEFLEVLKSAESFKTKQDTLWLASKRLSIARFEAVYF